MKEDEQGRGGSEPLLASVLDDLPDGATAAGIKARGGLVQEHEGGVA